MLDRVPILQVSTSWTVSWNDGGGHMVSAFPNEEIAARFAGGLSPRASNVRIDPPASPASPNVRVSPVVVDRSFQAVPADRLMDSGIRQSGFVASDADVTREMQEGLSSIRASLNIRILTDLAGHSCAICGQGDCEHLRARPVVPRLSCGNCGTQGCWVQTSIPRPVIANQGHGETCTSWTPNIASTECEPAMSLRDDTIAMFSEAEREMALEGDDQEFEQEGEQP